MGFELTHRQRHVQTSHHGKTLCAPLDPALGGVKSRRYQCMLCKCTLVTKKRYDLLNIKIRLNDINASQSAKHFIAYKARKNDSLRIQEFQKQTMKQKCMLFCTCVCGGSVFHYLQGVMWITIATSYRRASFR